ncbi:hypothetical protein Ancab_015589 [Ancistrocladus abbreviatus]
MTMTLLSSSPTPTHFPTLSSHSSSPKAHLTFTQKPYLLLLRKPNRTHLFTRVAADNEAGIVTSATAITEEKPLESHSTDSDPKLEDKNGQVVGTKGSPPPAPAAAMGAEVKQVVKKFQDPRWLNGTWDLKHFEKDGKTDWDTVIDAEGFHFGFLCLINAATPVTCGMAMLVPDTRAKSCPGLNAIESHQRCRSFMNHQTRNWSMINTSNIAITFTVLAPCNPDGGTGAMKVGFKTSAVCRSALFTSGPLREYAATIGACPVT